MHVVSGPKWLTSRYIFSSQYPHLTTIRKDPKVLRDGGTVSWKESGTLNHGKEGHPQTHRCVRYTREKQMSIMAVKWEALLVTAASTVLANMCVLSL